MADIPIIDMDAGTDSPRLARTALLAAVQRLNDMTTAAGGTILGYDPVTAYASGIGKHLNYTFGRTALEIAAGVTPTNYGYFPGDIRRYGAVAGGSSSANATAAQLAINTGHRVFSPVGTFAMGATVLDIPTGTAIEWESRASTWQWSGAAQMLRGLNGTTTRTFDALLISGTITNTTRATSGGIGIDFKSMSRAKVFGLQILEVETGIKNGGASSQGAFYNDFSHVDISGCVTAVDNGTLGNAVNFHAGRINDCVTCWRDNDNTGNQIFGTSLETFTGRAILVADTAATQGHRYLPSRVENGPIGLDNRALAQFTKFDCPNMISVATKVLDASTTADTNAHTDDGLMLKSGTPIQKFLGTRATIDFPSIPAGQTADVLVSMTGVLATDFADASCTSAALEAGLTITAQATAGGVYVRCTNSTTSAINPASHIYAIVVWRF